MNQRVRYQIYLWQKAPFVRYLIPFIVGILLQYHFLFPLKPLMFLCFASLLLLVLFDFLSIKLKFSFHFFAGLFVGLLFLSLGSIITSYNDIREDKANLINAYVDKQIIQATLLETPIAKTNSYKADAAVVVEDSINSGKQIKGKIIIYFKKDSLVQTLTYGSVILFKKELQAIKNAGNPGGFNYRRYSVFQQISHQVNLSADDYVVTDKKHKTYFNTFLVTIRKWVIKNIETYIPGSKEQGLAEAILIGYKDKLEMNLVQSYTNTGVVHLIAISGMHLGMIFLLLQWILLPIKRKKYLLLNAILILLGLWTFCFIAGSSASIVRSAVMFSFIVIGESFSRKTSIYNTLAASAFFLLCYNPFWLWDVGFQLSYAAVLSIVVFMKPIYNLLYFKNKILDFFWKIQAVSLAAQILTFPVSIYHFHQFPTLFFISNFFAVPIATGLVYSEIVLLLFSLLPFVAKGFGFLLHYYIFGLNTYIEWVEKLPYSLWDGLKIDIWQTMLIYCCIAGFSFFIFEKRKTAFWFSLISLLFVVTLQTHDNIRTNNQQKVVIYNVSGKQAIDFVAGKNYFFLGDSSLFAEDFGRNFHLKPSRIKYRVYHNEMNNSDFFDKHSFNFCDRKIVLIDDNYSLQASIQSPVTIDLLIVSGNPKLYFNSLSSLYKIKNVVCDGSAKQYKIKYWKKDCDSLQIPFHNVQEGGAFVYNIK